MGQDQMSRRKVGSYGCAKLNRIVTFGIDLPPDHRLLERMLGNADDGVRDRLTDFSRPVSGAFYFAPSQNALAEVAGPE
jgi:hypothetical protein